MKTSAYWFVVHTSHTFQNMFESYSVPDLVLDNRDIMGSNTPVVRCAQSYGGAQIISGEVKVHVMTDKSTIQVPWEHVTSLKTAWKGPHVCSYLYDKNDR